MAERRMFAKSIVGSGRFLRLQPTARLLYYDLGIYADDDGIVEAYTVITQTRANEDDLRVLVGKGFVKILNDDLVTQILDWNTNNFIRTDRYHPSIYKDLMLQLPSDNQRSTTGIPDDNQRSTEVSIGKDSIGNNKKPKHTYGEFKNVLFTDDELEKLKQRFPEDYLERIEKLSVYVASTGKSYKSHYATLLNWARKEDSEKPKQSKVLSLEELEAIENGKRT